MDKGIYIGYIGIGLTVLLGLLPFVIKDMPPVLTWGGITCGIACIAWPFIPGHPRFDGPLLLVSLAVVSSAGAAGWWISLAGTAPAEGVIAPKEAGLKEEPIPASSVGIKTDGVRNLQIDGNNFSGLNSAIDVKNSESATITNNSIDSKDKIVRQFPPTGEYRGVSNEELRDRVIAFTKNMRACEQKYDAELHSLFAKKRAVVSAEDSRKEWDETNSELAKIQNAKNKEFGAVFLPRAISLTSELLNRVGGLEISSAPEAMSVRLGENVLTNGMLVGPRPMSAVADFLEYVSKKLK